MAEITIGIEEEGLLKVFGRSKVDKEGFAVVSYSLTKWVCQTAGKHPDLFELRGPDKDTGKYRVKPTDDGATILRYLK